MKNLLFATAVVVVGCTDAPETTAPAPEGGTVSMQEMSATRIAGTFTADTGDALEFEGRVLDTNLVTVTFKLHGMTIDSTLDTSGGNRMWTQDAFATNTGADTTISEEDQQLIYAFVKVTEKQYPISKGDGLAFHFGVVADYWAQWIPAMEVTRIKFEDRDRATDMCWFAQSSTGAWPQGDTTPPASGSPRYHNYDGHDCSTCAGDPLQGQGISSCSSYGGFGVWDSSTWYYYNGAWQSSSNGHGGGAGTYLEGDCYGRYGAGCGGGHAYFEENASHDHCVRNGHNLVSSWCSDELASTTAPYNCY